MYTPTDYLRNVQKLTTVLERGLISPEEYADSVLGGATLQELDAAIARQIVDIIPLNARAAFATVVDSAAAPNFQFPPPAIGGPGPGPERLAELAHERTRRVKTWAAAFQPLLETA